MQEPCATMHVRIPISRWRALLAMAKAERRTSQQQLAFLLDRWWTQEADLKAWQEEAYRQFPKMREPQWWLPTPRRKDDAAD